MLTNCFIIYFGPPSVTIFPLEDIQNLYNKLTKSILALHIWFQLSCSTHDEYWMNFYEPFTLWWMWYQWFKGVRILWTRMLKNKLNCLEYKLTGPIMMSIVLRGPIKFVLAKFFPMANNRESQKKLKRGPKSVQSKGSPAVPLCSTCLSVISRGKRHICTKSNFRNLILIWFISFFITIDIYAYKTSKIYAV